LTIKHFIDGVGWGLLQFTFYSIKYDLYKYAIAHNGSVADMDVQLDFIEYSVKKEQATAWKDLHSTSITNKESRVKEYTNIIFSRYERADDPTLSKRMQYAVEIYNEYAK
jgi:hypothetical protein